MVESKWILTLKRGFAPSTHFASTLDCCEQTTLKHLASDCEEKVILCGQTPAQKVRLGWKNGDPQWHDCSHGRAEGHENMHAEHMPTVLSCTMYNSPVQPVTEIWSATYTITESGMKVSHLPSLWIVSFGGYTPVRIFPAIQSTSTRQELTAVKKAQIFSMFKPF